MIASLALRLAATVALCAAAASAAADPLTPAESVRRLAERQAQATLAPQGLRADISVGRIHPRALSECQRSEAFLPPGVRLWGRSHIGLRCVEGADWTLLVPVQVRVFGPALVTSRPLPVNQPIDTASLSPAEVELTRQSLGVVANVAELDGQVLSRPIGAGQVIPLAALKAPQVITAGEMVKVVGVGRGFAVSLTGRALTAAQDGQLVRVRTEAGKIVSGIARAGGRVEVVL
ncbi:MAG: flagellar basal body P-ring formation chaperone FlgA [Burkholderiaceae bacterium]